jgi:hypothetical protein
MPKIILLFFLILFINGCTGPLAVIGQIYGGADTISSLTTGKSATDAIISTGSKQDCRIHRLFKEKPVCKKIDIKNEENKKKNNVEVKKQKSFFKKIGNFFNFMDK